MIKIPLGNGGWFIIIEPKNIAKMKEGSPLFVRQADLLVAFTPDMPTFTAKLLGRDVRLPDPNEEIWQQTKLTPKQIDKALKDCQNLPEVLR